MSQCQANSIIALISMAWGLSYLLMKIGLNEIAPFNMIALRFGIAFFVTALIFISKVRKVNLHAIRCGAISGLLLFIEYSFLAFGVKGTTASTAGFLFGTTVVFVLILQMIITRKRPRKKIVTGIILTMTGITLLTVQDSLTFNIGAVLCIIGAFLYAWHIILTDFLTHRTDGLLLGIFQIGFAGLFGLLASLCFETPSLPSGGTQWGAVLGLALICTAFAFVMQPIAQQYTTPEHTGLLLALEPVFSAIFAFVFLQEVLLLKGYIGAVFVLCGVLISNMKSGKE